MSSLKDLMDYSLEKAVLDSADMNLDSYMLLTICDSPSSPGLVFELRQQPGRYMMNLLSRSQCSCMQLPASILPLLGVHCFAMPQDLIRGIGTSRSRVLIIGEREFEKLHCMIPAHRSMSRDRPTCCIIKETQFTARLSCLLCKFAGASACYKFHCFKISRSTYMILLGTKSQSFWYNF